MRTIKAGLLLALLALPVAAQAQQIELSARRTSEAYSGYCEVVLYAQNLTNKTISFGAKVEVQAPYWDSVVPFSFEFIESGAVKSENADLPRKCLNAKDLTRIVVRQIISCRVGGENFPPAVCAGWLTIRPEGPKDWHPIHAEINLQ